MSEDEPSDVVGHDLRGCIPVEVRASPASQPIRVTLAAGNGNCGS